jgi:hypothetical protein
VTSLVTTALHNSASMHSMATMLLQQSACLALNDKGNTASNQPDVAGRDHSSISEKKITVLRIITNNGNMDCEHILWRLKPAIREVCCNLQAKQLRHCQCNNRCQHSALLGPSGSSEMPQRCAKGSMTCFLISQPCYTFSPAYCDWNDVKNFSSTCASRQ